MQTTTVKFNFKTIQLESGVEGVPATDYKRPSVELNLPQLGTEDVLAMLEAGGKGLELLLATVNDVIYSRTRDLMAEAIEDNGAVVLNQEWLDAKVGELAWDVIAAIPPGKKGSAGIAKETWAAFEADYIAVMQQIEPTRALERTKLAAKYLKTKFSSIKGDKKAITTLQGFLGQWFAATTKAEDFAEVFAAVNNRATELLSKEVSALDSIA